MHTKLLPILLISLYTSAHTNAELSGLFSALQYFGATALQSEELGLSRGQTHYNFETYALQGDRHSCAPDDKHILHLLQQRRQPSRKPPIMIKCLQPTEAQDNTTAVPNKLLLMKHGKDIVNLLKPIGNATKRHEHGSCVVVHFCTPTSLGCATVAPVINLLPYMFPSLRIAYIDAYEFPGFNAEFGIVGLPTLMIFHQGRPIVKYQSDERNHGAFITRHTNIEPVRTIHPLIKRLTRDSPLSNVPEVQTDYYLGVAWAFILVCLANYLRRTLLWKQLVEMVQRNWRESEETQMEMVD